MMYAYPNEIGRYGEFGGKFVPETLMQPLAEIEQAFRELKKTLLFKQNMYHYFETIQADQLRLHMLTNYQHTSAAQKSI